ncbi:carbon-nitrogen hydrolase family protein [Candidatus Nitrosotenuis aquarius]|uniref:carbon-nitrogen hydrolase family protein n=1 Tax=Candidatus Nitrosotenuis aquarius TaxID=1846278 RepID=UPI000C1DCEBF|nr:carbon-nitrogen hydrolase family protein [Candidatus Nitrosotenuis aquarius]
MVKLGIAQTVATRTNEEGIKQASHLLERLGKNEADVVCLPEQYLTDNKIDDFEATFAPFAKIAKQYSMSVIAGAFYTKSGSRQTISAPVIDGTGQFIGVQDKIHPFDYEKDDIKPGVEAKIFSTKCKFGVIICYDMVFSDVAETLVKKGAEVLFSPARIVRRGIYPWHLYCQTRSLENRIPILAANTQTPKFGGKSIIVDLEENDGVMIPKTKVTVGQGIRLESFDLGKYEKSRKIRYSDHKKFS